MSAFSETRTAEETPEPSAALSFVRVVVEAYVARLPRKEAVGFLSVCADIFGERDAAATVIPLRGSERTKRQIHADRQALAEFRRMLESCMARMNAPKEDEDEDDT